MQRKKKTNLISIHRFIFNTEIIQFGIFRQTCWNSFIMHWGFISLESNDQDLLNTCTINTVSVISKKNSLCITDLGSQDGCLIYWFLVYSSSNHTMMLNLVILNSDDVNLQHLSVMKGKTDCIHLLYNNRISHRTEHQSKNPIWGVKLMRKSVI